MNPNDMLKLDNQLCFAFYACSREIMKLYRPILSEFGLTYTQYIALLTLWEKDNVTVKELGSRMYLDSGTLTPLLKKLELMGLINRTRDKNDERNVLIKLTKQGIALKQSATDIPCKLYENTGVTEEDITSLREQINSLMHKIEPAR